MKSVKYTAIAIGGLMLAGIATVMFLARGTGEDITGVVAPALLIALISGVVATVASMCQKGDEKPIGVERNNKVTG